MNQESLPAVWLDPDGQGGSHLLNNVLRNYLNNVLRNYT